MVSPAELSQVQTCCNPQTHFKTSNHGLHSSYIRTYQLAHSHLHTCHSAMYVHRVYRPLLQLSGDKYCTWMRSFLSSSTFLWVASCSCRCSAFMGTLMFTRNFLLQRNNTLNSNLGQLPDTMLSYPIEAQRSLSECSYTECTCYFQYRYQAWHYWHEYFTEHIHAIHSLISTCTHNT